MDEQKLKNQQLGNFLLAFSDVLRGQDPATGVMQRQMFLQEQEEERQAKLQEQEINKAIDAANLPESQKQLLKMLPIETKYNALYAPSQTKTPMSYIEFQLAQRDPKFAKYLDDRAKSQQSYIDQIISGQFSNNINETPEPQIIDNYEITELPDNDPSLGSNFLNPLSWFSNENEKNINNQNTIPLTSNVPTLEKEEIQKIVFKPATTEQLEKMTVAQQNSYDSKINKIDSQKELIKSERFKNYSQKRQEQEKNKLTKLENEANEIIKNAGIDVLSRTLKPLQENTEKQNLINEIDRFEDLIENRRYTATPQQIKYWQSKISEKQQELKKLNEL